MAVSMVSFTSALYTVCCIGLYKLCYIHTLMLSLNHKYTAHTVSDYPFFSTQFLTTQIPHFKRNPSMRTVSLLLNFPLYNLCRQ
jgi:hypothetical protein